MTGLLSTTTYTVDPWDPGYGVALGDELDGRESSARLELDLEVKAADWKPVSPAGGPLPGSVLFLDGVRRIDARVWVHGQGPEPLPGVAASLALALALSHQVVGLSGGKRDLNSMFLDEGFGTLDESTLDTVAATLERLAAETDRMVGIVTHVPALAERVPVQFAVTRDGASSRLRRVEV